MKYLRKRERGREREEPNLTIFERGQSIIYIYIYIGKKRKRERRFVLLPAFNVSSGNSLSPSVVCACWRERDWVVGGTEKKVKEGRI